MTPELRVDALTGLRVLVAPGGEPLSAGAEDPPRAAKPDLFTAVGARGAHELIDNAPGSAATTLAELAPDAMAAAVERWRERMRAHAGASYVHLHVDEDPQATAPPSRAQLHAFAFVPAVAARERERFGAYATRTMGGNLLADLVQEEVRARDRIVAIDDEAVLMVPYAARSAYALMLVPRRPQAAFEADGPTGAALLHDGLQRLARRFGAGPPLSLWVRTAPGGADPFCWHVDVLPRLTAPGGLELGTGLERLEVTPEQAAAQLRDA